MAQVDVGAESYDVFADVDQADIFNGGDMLRAPIWAATSADNKGRALVSATRLLLRLQWEGGAPAFVDTNPVVIDACSALAADIVAKPALSISGNTQSNVKTAKAGSAQVEFFKQERGAVLPIPSGVFEMLVSAGLISTGGGAEPYVSGCGEISGFDRNPYHHDWREPLWEI